MLEETTKAKRKAEKQKSRRKMSLLQKKRSWVSCSPNSFPPVPTLSSKNSSTLSSKLFFFQLFSSLEETPQPTLSFQLPSKGLVEENMKIWSLAQLNLRSLATLWICMSVCRQLSRKKQWILRVEYVTRKWLMTILHVSWLFLTCSSCSNLLHSEDLHVL